MKKFLTAVPALILTTILAVAQFTAPVIPLAFIGGLVITQTACPKSESIVDLANQGIKYTNAAITVFQQNGQDLSRLVQFRDRLVKVRDAFKDKEIPSGVEAFAIALDIFENEIVEQVQRIENQTTRTIVLVGLVLVRVRLEELSDKVAEAEPELFKTAMSQPPRAARRGAPADPNPAATIEAFRKSKRWQCRASGPVDKYKAGQYVPMELCKKYPDNTQVETR